MGYEKIVKGATKLKMAAPKAKYIDPILQGTADPSELADIFRCLAFRMRDTAWTVVYKSLVVTHMMIREGRKDAALEYLIGHGHINMLECKQLTNSNAGRYEEVIKNYSAYLRERAKQFANLKIDYVRHMKDNPKKGRLRTLTVEKGLLREVEAIQAQLHYLLACRFAPNEVTDEITLTAFRLLVLDLFALHQAVNEGTINVLEHYFEMSKFDAERALDIYNIFVKQMDSIIEYFQVARSLQNLTKLHVPDISHAPTSLSADLKKYLEDPDFDVNRRQFLAQKEAKTALGKVGDRGASKVDDVEPHHEAPVQVPEDMMHSSPEQTLTNYFSAIEQQVPVFSDGTGAQAITNPVQQQVTGQSSQPGFVGYMQPTSTGVAATVYPQAGPPAMQPPYVPLTSDFTGAGFGGYTSQTQAQSYPTAPMVQSQLPTMQQPQPANYLYPMPTAQNNFNGLFSNQALMEQSSLFTQQMPQQQQSPLAPTATGSTNPFRRTMTGLNPQFTGISPQLTGSTGKSSQFTSSSNPFHAVKAASFGLESVPEQPSAVTPAPLVPQYTSSNPFAKQPITPSPLAQTVTGNGGTNPFRQSII
ncbi:ANTH domain-containing protein [Limtongia smithiae]|uniref:ANTH domain-containing protein n=1 Tax=Limtongia smithiae TaxID=1125753 RepID=UPI0034CF0358